MKTLNDYLVMSYRLEIVRDDAEGGFVASYPDLPGCITCGETEEEAVKNALDAKKVWLEAALEDGLAIPAPDSLEAYSGQFKLRLPRSLHRALAEHSQRAPLLYALGRTQVRRNAALGRADPDGLFPPGRFG